MISILITLVVVGLICWLLLWAVGYIGLPEPFAKVATVIIVLFAVIYLITILLPLIGTTGLPLK